MFPRGIRFGWEQESRATRNPQKSAETPYQSAEIRRNTQANTPSKTLAPTVRGCWGGDKIFALLLQYVEFETETFFGGGEQVFDDFFCASTLGN